MSMTHKAVKRIGAVLVIIFAAGCGGAAGSNSSGFTEEGDDYHRPDDTPFEVVYGIDNRGEACLKCDPSIAHPDLQLQNLANSVGILVRPQAVITEAGGETMLAAYPLGERIERMYQAPLCEGERFADQPAPGFCTRFLVGEDIFVTAAHCIPDQLACDQTQVVFGYQVGEGGEIARLNEQSNVYGCET